MALLRRLRHRAGAGPCGPLPPAPIMGAPRAPTQRACPTANGRWPSRTYRPRPERVGRAAGPFAGSSTPCSTFCARAAPGLSCPLGSSLRGPSGPALADRLLVVPPPAGERHVRPAERRAGYGRPRTGRPRTAANGVRARQPNRQGGRHRRGRFARRSLFLGRQSRTRGIRPSEPSGASARRWSTRTDVCSSRRSRPPTSTTRISGPWCCASRGGSGPSSPGAGRMRALPGRACAHATPVRIAVVGARSRTRGFTVQERRWVIERTFGIFGHNRRLARDHEGRPDVAAGWITLASAAQMLRRLARA